MRACILASSVSHRYDLISCADADDVMLRGCVSVLLCCASSSLSDSVAAGARGGAGDADIVFEVECCWRVLLT